jgi:hypothetical protein
VQALTAKVSPAFSKAVSVGEAHGLIFARKAFFVENGLQQC